MIKKKGRPPPRLYYALDAKWIELKFTYCDRNLYIANRKIRNNKHQTSEVKKNCHITDDYEKNVYKYFLVKQIKP